MDNNKTIDEKTLLHVSLSKLGVFETKKLMYRTKNFVALVLLLSSSSEGGLPHRINRTKINVRHDTQAMKV